MSKLIKGLYQNPLLQILYLILGSGFVVSSIIIPLVNAKNTVYNAVGVGVGIIVAYSIIFILNIIFNKIKTK
jgi:hypothetical protein